MCGLLERLFKHENKLEDGARFKSAKRRKPRPTMHHKISELNVSLVCCLICRITLYTIPVCVGVTSFSCSSPLLLNGVTRINVDRAHRQSSSVVEDLSCALLQFTLSTLHFIYPSCRVLLIPYRKDNFIGFQFRYFH